MTLPFDTYYEQLCKDRVFQKIQEKEKKPAVVKLSGVFLKWKNEMF